MGERTKFKIEAVFETDIGVSNIETGEKYTLTLGKKVIKSELVIGNIYEGYVNSNYLNFVFKKDEKKVEQRKEEKVVIPKAPEVPKSVWNDTKQDDILAQSTLKIATEIAITSMGNKISLEAVKGFHREIFNYMKTKEYLIDVNKVLADKILKEAGVKKDTSEEIPTIDLEDDDI
jgi:hypothetical protein